MKSFVSSSIKDDKGDRWLDQLHDNLYYNFRETINLFHTVETIRAYLAKPGI